MDCLRLFDSARLRHIKTVFGRAGFVVLVYYDYIIGLLDGTLMKVSVIIANYPMVFRFPVRLRIEHGWMGLLEQKKRTNTDGPNRSSFCFRMRCETNRIRWIRLLFGWYPYFRMRLIFGVNYLCFFLIVFVVLKTFCCSCVEESALTLWNESSRNNFHGSFFFPKIQSQPYDQYFR